MKLNHRNYQLITQMMIQSKTTFSITIDDYHNWIKSKFMAQ